MSGVAVVGAFDDIRISQVKFLEAASQYGRVTVCLPSDDELLKNNGVPPRFPINERIYFLESIRYVQSVVTSGDRPVSEVLQKLSPDAMVFSDNQQCENWRTFCDNNGVEGIVAPTSTTSLANGVPSESSHPSAIVTGCYDWFHSGHVRFFEEASQYGELYVVVGSDVNVRLLKGEGHPLYPEEERRYMAGAIRYVHSALVSTGVGWMDAAPEIEGIKPDFYIVNEDGDKPEKRAFCEEHAIQYVVLKRLPADGLPKRQSTDLRGF